MMMSDLISRNALCEFCLNTKDRTVDANDIMRFPSAEPERKKGKWEEKQVIDDPDHGIPEWQSAKCSVCGKYLTTPYLYYFDNYKFCPHCGADMRGE
jgi:hypothetical protein